MVRTYVGGRVEVLNAEGAAEVKAAGKSVSGEGAFLVSIEGEKATKRTFSAAARVEVK